jgi:hypothetical protein
LLGYHDSAPTALVFSSFSSRCPKENLVSRGLQGRALIQSPTDL